MATFTFPPFKANEKVPLTITPVDAANNIVPGIYSWSVSDTAVATLEVAADTMSAFLIALAAGPIIVAVTDGNLIDSADSSVIPVIGPVVALNLAAGPAVSQ